MSETPDPFEVIATDIICQRVYALIALTKQLEDSEDPISAQLLVNMGAKLVNSITITPAFPVPQNADNVIQGPWPPRPTEE